MYNINVLEIVAPVSELSKTVFIFIVAIILIEIRRLVKRRLINTHGGAAHYEMDYNCVAAAAVASGPFTDDATGK